MNERSIFACETSSKPSLPAGVCKKFSRRRSAGVNSTLRATTPKSESLSLLFSRRRSVLLSGGGMSANIFIAVQKRFTLKTLSPGCSSCWASQRREHVCVRLAARPGREEVCVFVSAWGCLKTSEVLLLFQS
jgi:hypothetical protein